MPLDGGDGPAHAWVQWRKKPDRRQQQQAGIELLRSVRLDEAAQFAIESSLADLVVNRLPQRAPLVDLASQPAPLHRLDPAVEGHPRHDLGMGEMSGTAAYLPDALVRLIPYQRHLLEQRTLKGP